MDDGKPNVTIKLLGVCRSIAERAELTLGFEGEATLKDVIDKIVKKVPRLKKVLIDSDLEDPRINTLILVDGKEISVLNGLETRIENGNEIVLVSVLHAG